MHWRKKIGLWLLALVMVVALAACGSEEPADNGVTDPGDDDEVSQVVVALGADARTLLSMKFIDWTTHVPISNIYDALLTRQPDMTIVAHLATEWTYLDDETLEMKLRDDVTFHNGEPFNAAAVKYTVEYINNPDNDMAYAGRYAPVAEVEIVDDYTVRFHTSGPMPILLDRLTSFYPLEPGYVEEVGQDKAATEPVGTGPYKFVEWQVDERIVLEKNEDYWGGVPTIDRMVFRPIPEFSTRLASLMTGEIDLMRDVPGHMVDLTNASENSEIRAIPSARINYLALVNLKEGPMQSKLVRQAMNYAVNVPELIEYVQDGNATQMAGPLSILNDDYHAMDPYPFDPGKAVDLIREAGYEPSDMKLLLDTPDGRYPQDKEVAFAIAAQLADIGIDVQVRVNEWGTHLDRIINRDTGDMFILGWGPALEAQGTIESLMTTTRTYSGFGLPWLDEKVAAAVPVVDPVQRAAVWREIQEDAFEEAPWVFLWQQHDLWGVNVNLVWTPVADERIQAFHMRWSD